MENTNNYYNELFKNWTLDNLQSAIWTFKNGMCPVGGYPLEWYETELYLRIGSKKGWHE